MKPDTMTPLTAAEAARRIIDEVPRQPALRVPLDDALAAVLAETIVSPIDIPPWPNSAMDGYATRSDDVRGASPAAPVRLRVVEHIPAGHFATRAIGPGECARIFTGAPIPAGADGVVRQEDTDLGPEMVTIVHDRDARANIREAGEDVRRGATVLAEGAELGPAHLGMLASLAVAHPLVYRKPRVAILASGDEVADIDQPEAILRGEKIGSSNTHALVALVRQAGGAPVNLGIARDTPASMREHLARALDCDLIVTTAGISVGEHDYVRVVLEELGLEQRFWKVRMRPGSAVGFGFLRGVPWIGLPGNPVSTMVTFELFVRPAIRTMSGHRIPFRRGTTVRTVESITLKPKLQHFLRAIVTDGPDGPEAKLTGPQGSGILTSMLQANALLMIPEGQYETPARTSVSAFRLDDSIHGAQPGF